MNTWLLYTLYIAKGISTTLIYTFIALGAGLILGTLFAVLRYQQKAVWGINSFVSFVRGTPLLVQLTAAYFVLPHLLGISISIFLAGCLAFSLNSSAYICEIIRAGLESLDKGQFEVGKSLNIPSFFLWKDIILPQTFKNIFPALTNEAISLLKETAIISTLGGEDIMRRAQMVSAEHYTYLAPLCAAAFCYYMLTHLITLVAKQIEKGWCYD